MEGDNAWFEKYGSEHLPEDLLAVAAPYAAQPCAHRVFNKYVATSRQNRQYNLSMTHVMTRAMGGVALSAAALVTLVLGLPVAVPLVLVAGALVMTVRAAGMLRFVLRKRSNLEEIFGSEISLSMDKTLLPRHVILARALWVAFTEGRRKNPEMQETLAAEVWEGFALLRDRDRIVRAAPSPELLEDHPVLLEVDARIGALVQFLANPAKFSRPVAEVDVQVFRRLSEDVAAQIQARTEMSRFLKE